MSNTQIESWLASRGAKFEQQRVALADIDREKSLHNQARVGAPLNEETVLLYGVAMEQGSQFPEIVVYRNGSGLFTVIDGNHRVAGADAAKIGEFDAYIVTNPNPTMIETLTMECNANHGLPTSLTERIQQARYLVARGMTMQDAAKLLHIPAGRIVRAQRIAEVDSRMNGIKRNTSALSTSIRHRLSSIRSDAVLKATIDLILSAKLSFDEVETLVTSINKQREDKEQLLVLQRERDRQAAKIAATAGGKVALPDSLRKLMAASQAVDRLDPKKIGEDFKLIGDDMRMVIIARVMDAHKRLREIM